MNKEIFYYFFGFSNISKEIDYLIVFFAETFPYIVVFIFGVFLLYYFKFFSVRSFREIVFLIKKDWEKIVFAPFSVGFAWILSSFIKEIFENPRPFEIFKDITPLFLETGYAFPSSHSAFFMALGFVVLFLNKKFGYFFIISALFIGIARIMAGVHSPIDIIGGFVLGFLVAYLCFLFFKRL